MPNIHLDDTIAAIATPPGEGGLSVIRLSGTGALAIAQKIFRARRGDFKNAVSHTLHFGEVVNEKEGILDQVVAGVFLSPHSYTGEDVIEVSVHGGVVVTRKILDLLIRAGARHAEPGEFTKRAFLNGKIDLTQAEAVLDLIRAKSEKSLESAVRQLRGSLTQKFLGLKEELMKMAAHMESFLDFPDEHLEIYNDKTFLEKFARVREVISQMIAGFNRGNLLREGISVVLTGKPNVGKSSLFNALLARDRALVSEFPGTTRDLLEEALEIQGFYVRLADTAGLTGKPSHPVEAMGIEKTRRRLGEAHLLIYMVDGSAPLEEEDQWVFEALREAGPKPVLVVINKADLGFKIKLETLSAWTGEKDFIRISTRTFEGIDILEKKIGEKIFHGEIETPGEQITRLRHKNALEEAARALERSETAFRAGESLEFVIVDLKSALDSLRELVGEIYSEDLLDIIFSEFCIGK